jgi:hypothetical protein
MRQVMGPTCSCACSTTGRERREKRRPPTVGAYAAGFELDATPHTKAPDSATGGEAVQAADSDAYAAHPGPKARGTGWAGEQRPARLERLLWLLSNTLGAWRVRRGDSPPSTQPCVEAVWENRLSGIALPRRQPKAYLEHRQICTRTLASPSEPGAEFRASSCVLRLAQIPPACRVALTQPAEPP